MMLFQRSISEYPLRKGVGKDEFEYASFAQTNRGAMEEKFQLDTSGNMLNVILLLGQWFHSRHQYRKPLDEPDVEGYKREEALAEEIR